MSHALATVLHRGRKAASNLMAACLASSREARAETGVWGRCLASRGGGPTGVLQNCLPRLGWKTLRKWRIRQGKMPPFRSTVTRSKRHGRSHSPNRPR